MKNSDWKDITQFFNLIKKIKHIQKENEEIRVLKKKVKTQDKILQIQIKEREQDKRIEELNVYLVILTALLLLCGTVQVLIATLEFGMCYLNP